MPKEAAWMVLTALFIARVPFFRSNSKKTLLPVGACMLLGVGMLTLSTQRQLFALHPSRNYYHWLIAENEIVKEGIPIVFLGDPVFFPNAYLYSRQSYFLIDQEEQNLLYKRFSKKIRVIDIDQIKRLNQLIIIGEDSQIENEFNNSHSRKYLGKLHEQLGLHVVRLEKVLKR